MGSPADILPGHPGSCEHADDWADRSSCEIAQRVMDDFQSRFAAHGARVDIVPIRFRSREVLGDGVAFRVEPLEGRERRQWMWWAEAEADMAIRQRRASDEQWTVLYAPDEVERLLRDQAETYLRQFIASEENPDAPYDEHDGTA